MEQDMFYLSKKFFLQKKKKFFLIVIFLLFLLSTPVLSYFLTSDYNFDRRTEAAVFNALVQEMEERIHEYEHVPGVIRLEFPDNVSNQEIEKIIGRKRNVPLELIDTPYERVEYVEVNVNNMAEEMARYERYTSVKDVDLNYVFERFWVLDGNNRVLPNDWNVSNHWYFNKIKLPEVWKMQGCLEGNNACGGDKNIIIAVIDSGLAFNAPEVQGMNIFSHATYNRNKHIDTEGHGTYVAGLIASATNNGRSSVGIAHNVTIMPLLDSDDVTSWKSSEEAIYYASQYGARVINMSFGAACPPSSFQPLKSALDFAVGKGVVLVASSGNMATDVGTCVGYPASDSRVIAVGAVNADNSRSIYSQYGSQLDFVAPVGQVRSAGNATWHETLSCAWSCNAGSNFNSFANKYEVGTSFSAPQVAGAAGLILSLDPTLTPAQVKKVLIDTVDDIGATGKDAQTGYGVLNLENIYKYFSPKCGDLNGNKFEYTQENWPSKNFCAPGQVNPAEPEFPPSGATTTWTCKGGDGTSVSCSVTRNPVPKPVCGDLNGAEFEAEVIRWPSRNFCSLGAVEPTYPVFPSFGEMTNWNCVQIYDNTSVSCSASRKLANPPLCGGLDGSRFLPDDEKWPSADFCSSGSSKPTSPRFPYKGRVVEWECIAPDGKSVTCSAERGSCSTNADCRSNPPYEVCVENFCLRGDIIQDGQIDGIDFKAFKEDFLTFKERKWRSVLIRSDLNTDYKITMADYSIFVRTYRAFNNLD